MEDILSKTIWPASCLNCRAGQCQSRPKPHLASQGARSDRITLVHRWSSVLSSVHFQYNCCRLPSVRLPCAGQGDACTHVYRRRPCGSSRHPPPALFGPLGATRAIGGKRLKWVLLIAAGAQAVVPYVNQCSCSEMNRRVDSKRSVDVAPQAPEAIAGDGMRWTDEQAQHRRLCGGGEKR